MFIVALSALCMRISWKCEAKGTHIIFGSQSSSCFVGRTPSMLLACDMGGKLRFAGGTRILFGDCIMDVLTNNKWVAAHELVKLAQSITPCSKGLKVAECAAAVSKVNPSVLAVEAPCTWAASMPSSSLLGR